jgi:hypothetical protein
MVDLNAEEKQIVLSILLEHMYAPAMWEGKVKPIVVKLQASEEAKP